MLNIPTLILDFLNLEKSELFESIIIGLFGGLASILASGIKDLFIDYHATMGGDPTQGSSSFGTINTSDGDLPNRQIGGSGSSDLARHSESGSEDTEMSDAGDNSSEDTEMPDAGESSSHNNTQSSSEDTQMEDAGESSSGNPSRRNYTAERLAKVLDKYAADLSEGLKNLSINMDKATEDEEWRELRDQRDSEMEGVQVMSKASADQAKKAAEWPQEDSSSTITKRDLDAVEKEDKE